MFKEGDKILCVVAGKIGPKGAMFFHDFSKLGKLTEGKVYTVLSVDGGTVTIIDDKGNRFFPYASRFVLAPEDYKEESPVIRKIRQMESRRKEMGYAI